MQKSRHFKCKNCEKIVDISDDLFVLVDNYYNLNFINLILKDDDFLTWKNKYKECLKYLSDSDILKIFELKKNHNAIARREEYDIILKDNKYEVVQYFKLFYEINGVKYIFTPCFKEVNEEKYLCDCKCDKFLGTRFQQFKDDIEKRLK